ncbi:hypothetical protein P3T76_015954 [Phytophthora citrophthora]|uniref:Uncharacterized protein n=1 Tax=Phytophthora citrophthora TaxID=4793 RepID=A0AAD9FYY4_9STRA|nr:hypothetical protein P3T76_015954 [Phytophthora citrophthora]
MRPTRRRALATALRFPGECRCTACSSSRASSSDVPGGGASLVEVGVDDVVGIGVVACDGWSWSCAGGAEDWLASGAGRAAGPVERATVVTVVALCAAEEDAWRPGSTAAACRTRGEGGP